MVAAQIKFGTSGWRAVVADEFTFANVRRAVRGIARYVAGQKPAGAKVIVGRDPRFMGETLCSLAAEVLGAHQVTPLVIAEAAPTPAISYAVTQAKADGAINFTASHNPPEYNGIKFSTPDGAPALPEVTKKIEAEIAAGDEQADAGPVGKRIEAQPLDPRRMYLARLREIVDLGVIKKAGLRVAFDPLWGAARGYSDVLLREAGVDVGTVHDYRDVLFGGHAPEPDDHLLEDLRKMMREKKAQIGIATDGDADRFGIVDEDGTFFQPNYIIALLFDYLVESRGWKNGVAKSVATTNLINALAKLHKVELHETPVGFKYIGEKLLAGEIGFGGEESAGLTVEGHVPEKDGILADLMAAELVGAEDRSLPQLRERLWKEIGPYLTRRVDLKLSPEEKSRLARLRESPPETIGRRRVATVNRLDGIKLILEDGSWILVRESGTEPVARVYVEAHSPSDLEALTRAGRELIA
jgi:alpha-D-glucose phosphate-specific phosphoglucomutase